MKPKISVIVPVYKVEPYLKKCVDSLINQTFKEIEIILIDDGSPDDCGLICDQFAENDLRIKVIHKENGGVSSARNCGLAAAQGKYVTFVDSDDYVSVQLCEKLYYTAEKTNADLVMSNLQHVDIFGNPEATKRINLTMDTIMNHNQALQLITNLNYPVGVNTVTKLFRKEIVSKFRFSDGVPLGEDIEFVFSYLNSCKLIALCNEPLYYYVQRSDSATHKPFVAEREEKLRDLCSGIFNEKLWNDSLELNNRLVAFRICICELTIINKMLLSGVYNKKTIVEIQKYIRKNIFKVSSAKFPIWKKIQILLAAINMLFYRRAFIFVNRLNK